MATRLQLRERLARELGEVKGAAGFADPLSLDDCLSDEADTLAEALFCYHAKFYKDIFTGETCYCAPPVFYLTAVTATWADGTEQVLRPTTTGAEDDRQGTAAYPINSYAGLYAGRTGWRSNPQSGNPTEYMARGLNEIQIYPAPNYSTFVYSYTDLYLQYAGVVGGIAYSNFTSVARPFTSADVGRVLTVSGGAGFTTGRYRIATVTTDNKAQTVAAAGTAGSTNGVGTLSTGGLCIEGYATPTGLWPLDTDSQPIAFGDEAVLAGAKVRRCEQFAHVPQYAARLPRLLARYKEARGKLERAAADLSPASRGGLNAYRPATGVRGGSYP